MKVGSAIRVSTLPPKAWTGPRHAADGGAEADEPPTASEACSFVFLLQELSTAFHRNIMGAMVRMSANGSGHPRSDGKFWAAFPATQKEPAFIGSLRMGFNGQSILFHCDDVADRKSPVRVFVGRPVPPLPESETAPFYADDNGVPGASSIA